MEPIEEVMKELGERGFSLALADALELFGRKGTWQTINYSNLVSTLEVWEIRPEFLNNLKKNLSNAEIKITNTYEEIKKISLKFDLIIIDNPMGIYGEKGNYCEHFALFPEVIHIARDKCVMILNVNLEPFNLFLGDKWWQWRKKFYNSDTPEKLSFDDIKTHYNNLFKKNGFNVEWNFFVPKPRKRIKKIFIYYFVVYILKIQNNDESSINKS